MRLLVRIVVLLAALAAIAAAGMYLHLRRSLPVLEGEIAVAGLSGRVEILRDPYGIPHIFAGSVERGDNEERALALLHIAIREPTRATVVGSPYFEPDQIVGIINDAHLVCFGVTHTQHRFVPNAEYIFRGRASHLSKTLRTVHGKKELNSEPFNC